MERGSAAETPGRTPGLLVVLNPTSGAGEGRRVRAEVERELQRRGLDYTLIQTEGPGHATELAARATRNGVPIVAAVGGDGTIHEIANGILDVGAGGTALAMIPVGRGNDFVKVIAGATPRRLAYDTLAGGVCMAVDVGRVEWAGGGRWFVNAMGTGIDVEVVRQIARTRNLPAGLVYIVGLVKALARFRGIPLRVTVDGVTFERKLMMLAVTNGRCVGGSFRLSPTASPDDGALNVCAIDEVGLWGAARVVPRVLRGTHMQSPVVHMLEARNGVTIETTDGKPIFLQLDGELHEPGAAWAHVAISPRRLQVIAAARRQEGS